MLGARAMPLPHQGACTTAHRERQCDGAAPPHSHFVFCVSQLLSLWMTLQVNRPPAQLAGPPHFMRGCTLTHSTLRRTRRVKSTAISSMRRADIASPRTRLKPKPTCSWGGCKREGGAQSCVRRARAAFDRSHQDTGRRGADGVWEGSREGGRERGSEESRSTQERMGRRESDEAI